MSSTPRPKRVSRYRYDSVFWNGLIRYKALSPDQRPPHHYLSREAYEALERPEEILVAVLSVSPISKQERGRD